MDAADRLALKRRRLSTGLPTDTQALTLLQREREESVQYRDRCGGGHHSDLFGLGTLAVPTPRPCPPQPNVTSTATCAFDLAALTHPRQDLVVGLLDTRTEGAGFDSLTFQVIREGVMVVNQTFITVAAAVTFLDNSVLDLGSNGVGNVSGNLDLVFDVSLTTNDAGAGFYFDLVFGNSTVGSASSRRLRLGWRGGCRRLRCLEGVVWLDGQLKCRWQ